MKNYQGYLIDLDGTIYRGNEVIPGAVEFIEALQSSNKEYLFLTNNSSVTGEMVRNKLHRMGINTTEEHVFTSSMATATYINNKKEKASCMVIGGEGLHEAIHNKGLEITNDLNCDFVVIGLDEAITYEKLANACLAIQQGAAFISTNSDQRIPSERGFLPGNGAMTSVISVSTGVKPTFIGKPEEIIMQEALTTIGLDKEETIMVGDNYQTDICAGMNIGMDTLMVFTGVTPFDAYPDLTRKPTYYVHSLVEWLKKLIN